MCLYVHLCSKTTFAEDLYQLLRRDKASSHKFVDTHLRGTGCFNQGLNRTKIDSLVFYAIDIFKTKFRYSTLKRHLATFKTNLS